MSDPPRLASRLYAHEGCYLCIPDDRYVTCEKPFVDMSLVTREVTYLKREIDEAARLGFTGFVHLMLCVDDLVTYEALDHPLKQRRRQRADALATSIRELVDFAHARQLEYFVQNYELVLDRWVARRITGASLRQILTERFREFFGKTGVDGIVVTPAEARSRGGCEYVDWSPFFADIGEMAAEYHSIIEGDLGKKLRFRLWLQVMNEAQWSDIAGKLPKSIVVSMKNTGGDFWAAAPRNPLLAPASQQCSLSVLFDAFGQYHGWGHLLYFDPAWPGSVRYCRESGVGEVQVWGSWSPSCVWPNDDSEFLPCGHTYCAGLYHDNGLWEGRRLGGQLSLAYLMSLLDGARTAEDAIDQAAASCSLAQDGGHLEAVLRPLERLWREVYLPRGQTFFPTLDAWTMIFQIPRKTWRDFIHDRGRRVVHESNERMRNDVQMLKEQAHGVTDPELAKVWRLTELYFETRIAIREAACVDPSFAGEDPSTFDSSPSRRIEVCDTLKMLLRRWEDYPAEATAWCITEFDYKRLSVRPHWLRAGSLREYEEQLRLGLVNEIPKGEAFEFSKWDGR